MKKSRFADTQIVSILKQADARMQLKDICRQHGISDAMCYKWKAKYGGMDALDLKRVKELEAENTRLKRIYADLALENTAMKDLITKNVAPIATRDAAQFLGRATSCRSVAPAIVQAYPGRPSTGLRMADGA